jgi:hypothetical protein
LIPKEQTYYKAMKDLSNKCSKHGIKMHEEMQKIIKENKGKGPEFRTFT